MPSGKTHDAITFIITIPIFGITWSLADFTAAAIVTVGFLFGGLVFGPDLDTVSRQYHRWSIFRFLWYPYQKFFKHRSRWSHGLVFGTLIRSIYFAGVVTLFSFLLALFLAGYLGGKLPDLNEFILAWKHIGKFAKSNLGEYAIYVGFFGLWLGAASHTFTDIAGSYIKTGRAKGLL